MNWLRALLLSLVLVTPALALNPDEILPDPVLEQRARDISADVRCLVCQNQSIDDSDAELARDLRLLVRDRLVAGDSNDQVFQYLVDRYGEFVLLTPRFGNHTLILWIAGPLLLLIGVVTLVAFNRRRRVEPAQTGLTAEEQKALDELTRS
jgi:cytochrome c-type biogenesis protein CcmH